MAKVLDEVFAANRAYAAEFGDKGSLALPPARHFAIPAWMRGSIQPSSLVWQKAMPT
jgi:carbonic anhydrase